MPQAIAQLRHTIYLSLGERADTEFSWEIGVINTGVDKKKIRKP